MVVSPSPLVDDGCLASSTSQARLEQAHDFFGPPDRNVRRESSSQRLPGKQSKPKIGRGDLEEEFREPQSVRGYRMLNWRSCGAGEEFPPHKHLAV